MPKKKERQLQDYAGKFEQTIGLTCSRSTWVFYCRALDKFIERFKKRRKIDDFAPVDIDDYRLWRLREGTAPRTMRVELDVIRAFFQGLVDQGLLKTNPAKDIRVKHSTYETKKPTP